MANEVGRPTTLDDNEVTSKIRELVVQGLEYTQIRNKLNIADSTWDGWVVRNYKGFRDDLITWKHEHLVQSAEKNLRDLLVSEDERVRLDSTKFVLERLSKKHYSARQELTGSDGKELAAVFIKIDYPQKDNEQYEPEALQATPIPEPIPQE